jgi:hypothetical protein
MTSPVVEQWERELRTGQSIYVSPTAPTTALTPSALVGLGACRVTSACPMPFRASATLLLPVVQHHTAGNA